VTEVAFQTLLILAGAVFFSGALATIYFYVRLRQVDAPGVAPSFLRYFIFAALFGFVAYMAGSAIGIAGGCSSSKSGNLCGIWGALGVGPLSCGVALWAYGPLWLRRLSRRPPN
jgi:hypothetical protein